MSQVGTPVLTVTSPDGQEAPPNFGDLNKLVTIDQTNLDDLEQLYNKLAEDHKEQYDEYKADHTRWVNIHQTMKSHINTLTDQLKNLKHKYTEITKKLRALQKDKARLNKLEDENAKLKEMLKNLLKQINDTNELLNNNPYPDFLKFLDDMNQKLKDQENKWKKEKDGMQDKLNKLLKMLDDKIIEFEQIVKEQEGEIERLTAENEDLKKQLDEKDALIKELQAREKANALLATASDDDKDKLIRELQEYKDLKGEPAEKEVEKLNDELKEMDNELENLRALLRKKNDENDDLLKKIEKLENDCKEKDDRIAELERLLKERDNELKDKDNEISNKNDTIKEQSDEIERLKKLLEQERDDERAVFLPMSTADNEEKIEEQGWGVRMMEELGLVCAVYILICCVFVSYGLLIPQIDSFMNNWSSYQCLQPECIEKTVSAGILLISMIILGFFAILILVMFILITSWKKAKRWQDIKKFELPSLLAFVITFVVWVWWCFQVGIVVATFSSTLKSTAPGDQCNTGTTDTTQLFADAEKVKKNSLVALVIGTVPLIIIIIFFAACHQRFSTKYVYIDRQVKGTTKK